MGFLASLGAAAEQVAAAPPVKSTRSIHRLITSEYPLTLLCLRWSRCVAMRPVGRAQLANREEAEASALVLWGAGARAVAPARMCDGGVSVSAQKRWGLEIAECMCDQWELMCIMPLRLP